MAARLLLAAVLSLAAAAAGCGGDGKPTLPAGAARVPASTPIFVSADGRATPLLRALGWPAGPVALTLSAFGRPAQVVRGQGPAGRSLAESGAFRAAMARLPRTASLRAYVAGRAARAALWGLLRRAGLPLALTRLAPRIGWLALAASPQEGGFRLEGALAVPAAEEQPSFLPTLPRELPRGTEAALVLSRLDLPLGRLLARLEGVSGLGDLARRLDQAQAAVGLSLQGDILPALAGEAALLRLREGTALVLRLEAGSRRVLATLLARLAPVLALGRLGSLQPLPGGVYLLRVARRPLRLYIALERSRLLVADRRPALERLRRGPRLGQLPSYRRLVERADLPEELRALVYARRGKVLLVAGVEGGEAGDLVRGFLTFE